MANDLDSYKTDVKTILDDSSNARYTDAMIQKAIQATLQEFNQYMQDQVYTIDDLDSATSTTIPTTLAHIFHIGAAGWACLFRSAYQAEANVLQPDVTEALMALGKQYLETFRATFNLPNMSGRADKLLSEFKAGIKADVKSSGAVLPKPPVDTF